MRRIVAIVLFVITIALAFYAGNNLNYTVTEASSETVPNVVKRLVWTTSELGIPSKNSYDDTKLVSRCPWDITIFDGKLYVGGGDYGNNTGPVTVWRYCLTNNVWESTGTVNDEAVARFYEFDGKLIISGTDPKDEHDLGNYYVLNGSEWHTVRNVPHGVHMFDIVKFGGETFYAIGNEKNTQSPVQKTADGENFVNVPFYAHGKELLGNEKYHHSRCYALFNVNNRLYAFCKWYTVGSYGFFEYDGTVFNLVNEIPKLNIPASGVNRQSLVGERLTVDKKCYISFGTLYSTENFVTLTQIETPNGAYVQDMILSDGKMYVLTSQKSIDGYKNAVWEYSEADGFKEVFSFDYGLNAMSFTLYDGTFYIGIGNYSDKTAEKSLNGMIIKAEQQIVEEIEEAP